MKYILSPNEMLLADKTAIEEYAIPGLILMENAARSAADYVRILLEELEIIDVAIFCGSGNNGGDGFAMARHLFDDLNVIVYWIGSKEKMSEETLVNFEAVEKLEIDLIHIADENDLDKIELDDECIIDAMIGVGGSENIRGVALDILDLISGLECLKIAIDAPTGLNTETGAAHKLSFLANYTITMFATKTGMLKNAGIDCCGEIFEADLGAPYQIVEEICNTYAYDYEDVALYFPVRFKQSTKFDYGKTLVIAGSTTYPGAAALCANSAIKTGSGLVYLYSTEIHSSVLPEVIPCKLKGNDEGFIALGDMDKINEMAAKVDTIAIGPGLGDNPETIEVVSRVIENYSDIRKIIVDADGLRAINKDSQLNKNIILTPHVGEFARIIGISREEVEFSGAELVQEWADKLNCIILLKDVPSFISDGMSTYYNLNGNPGMATGGSGDVLTGIVASLYSQGLSGLHAASVGAFVHAHAGDIYVENYSEESLTATDLLNNIKIAFADLNDND
jgi:ADP-dependent NAD(P)H-hydrate dehydratase / NAD(P)H-hydrate epimerase